MKLPPGFVLEDKQGVNLPPGFVLEGQSNQPTSSPGNPIIDGVKGAFRSVSTIPAAANRAAIRSNPALSVAGPFANLLAIGNPAVSRAVMNPESVQTFQDQAIQGTNRLIDAVNPRAGMMTRANIGMIPSAVGLAADIATNPFDALLALVGKTPTGGGRNIETVIGQSKIGQALEKIGNTDVTTAPMKAISKPLRKIVGGLDDKEINAVIDQGINKGIRPTVAGKGSSSQIAKYRDNSREAVKQIILNKDNLNLVDDFGEPIKDGIPTNLQQFSDAISQTKKTIFNKYSSMTRRSEIRIPTEQFARNVERAANNKVIQVRFPGLQSYLTGEGGLADRLRNAGSLTTGELEEFIASLNSSLKAFYRNPNPAAVDQAVVEATLAKQMRTVLDDAIEGGYKELKKSYGALRSIEEEVAKRAIVDARKNNKGFFDLGDIVSTGDIVQGLLKMDPTQVARGTAQRSLVNYFKYLNNPNTAIKKMFTTIQKSVKPGAFSSSATATVDAIEPAAQRLLSGGVTQKLLPAPGQKMIGVDPIYGDGFERIMPEEAARRIGARTKDVVSAVNKTKALPPPMDFELVPQAEAYRRIKEFAFKYWSPPKKKIDIPENIVFGTKASTLLKKIGINPITGEIKSPKVKTALQAAISRMKSKS